MKKNNEFAERISAIKKIVEDQIVGPMKDVLLAADGSMEFSIENIKIPEGIGEIRNLSITSSDDGERYIMAISFEADICGKHKKDPSFKGLKLNYKVSLEKSSFISFIIGYMNSIMDIISETGKNIFHHSSHKSETTKKSK